jgi:uncharacterized protein YkwD
MNRRMVLLFGGAAALAACGGETASVPLGTDGKPLPRVYRIADTDAAQIDFRMLDAVNTLRRARGATALSFGAELNAAAATHARDMSVQNRPWHFGSDGSSPLVRVQRVGYTGKLLGELISETFQTELETLSAWMALPETRGVLLDPRASQMGFAWHQEPSGKIWWCMLLGAPAGIIPASPFGLTQ